MYHSKSCSGDKGVVIDFVAPVQYQDVLLHTRRLGCYAPIYCRHRYKNVCLYADDVKLGCTPADLKEAPAVINFKDYTYSQSAVIASQYRIMFEDSQCAQIEELYVQYLEVTGDRIDSRPSVFSNIKYILAPRKCGESITVVSSESPTTYAGTYSYQGELNNAPYFSQDNGNGYLSSWKWKLACF